MVTPVTRRLLGLLLFLSLPLSASQAVTLSMTPSQSRVEQGKAFDLLIEARDMELRLETVDLSAIKKAFRLVASDYSKSRDGTRQFLSLRLYPRLTGKVHLPPLVAGPGRSPPLDIEVMAARANEEPIRLTYRQSASTLWERQQLRVEVEVQTPDQFASLRLDEEEARLSGFEIIPLPPSRDWIDVDGKRRTRLRIGWLLFPLASGMQTLELPAIGYHLGGARRARYFLPVLTLQVRPLPPYIPPTLPVGKLGMTSTITPGGWLSSGELAEWTIHMQSDSLLPFWFPAVLRQLKSTTQIHFFPASTTRQTRPDRTGMHSQVVHHIPFKPLNNGRVELPALQFQYFDPERGRLVDVSHAPARPWTLSPLLQVVLPLLLLAVLYRPLRHVLRNLAHYLQRRKLTRQALTHLAEARSLADIQQALRQFARAEGWPQNFSLTAWQRRFESRYRHNQVLRDALQELANACYARAPQVDVEALKGRLREGLLKRKRTGPWKNRHRERDSSLFTTPPTPVGPAHPARPNGNSPDSRSA